MKRYKLIVFDLDGTLAKSRSNLDEEMGVVFSALAEKYFVSVISGGDFKQFEIQFLPNIKLKEESSKNLVLCPTCGSKMYVLKNGAWEKILSEDLSDNEIEKINNALEVVSKKLSNPLDKVYGNKIQNRGTQFTYSGLGDEAPLSVKTEWDPNQEKRKEIVTELMKIIPEFSIKIGGITSVDINRKGIDKAYGLKKLIEYFKIDMSDILFIGDAIFPGGNDYSAKEFGVDCVQVKDPVETMKKIKELLN